MTKFLITDIKITLDQSSDVAIVQAKKQLTKKGFRISEFDFSIYRKSIDARDKTKILLVYSVLVTTNSNIQIPKDNNFKGLIDDSISLKIGKTPLESRPIIVGMGPAGMFSALLLAENGYRPIIMDRGDNVHNRTKALEKFIVTGELDLDSNVQFGAGGAGTFSDGKLTTRINDSKCSYILQRFVEFGAPEEILTKAKPHIGTDILTTVVDNILKKIEECGGTVMYRCKLLDINLNSQNVSITTTKGNFETQQLILAIGHSARDTYKMLLSKNIFIEPKPFSVGVRVEHLQKDIDQALYGKFAGHQNLGPGEYNLSDTKGGRGVYTFCMCPGGEVVPATSHENGVCVNGMSKFARDGSNANCAVNVSIFTDDYGNNPHQAIKFQENLEEKAYIAGRKHYYAPIQLMGDFINDKAINEPSRILPTYANGNRVTVSNISNILPGYVSKRLKEGFLIFDKKINGFAVNDCVITGVETRTSAPVRIIRNDNLASLSSPYIYPCGEGAGYAGGIMSSAVDGLKIALKIINTYKP